MKLLTSLLLSIDKTLLTLLESSEDSSLIDYISHKHHIEDKIKSLNNLHS